MTYCSKLKYAFFALSLFAVCFIGEKLYASVGVINPSGGNTAYKAYLLNDDSVINFGYFTHPAVSAGVPVSVTDTELTGYIWGENIGWVSLNCSNSGSCADSDFKVLNSDGVLSGYAWGENVGWINFGPPAGGSTYPQVIIVPELNGNFFGYAWGENVGWIGFDCGETNGCVRTDWNATCNDDIDNDSDGFIDYPADPDCQATYDTAEGTEECSDGIDNDGDGDIDYPDDAECSSSTDNHEASLSSGGGGGGSSDVNSIIDDFLKNFDAPEAGDDTTGEDDGAGDIQSPAGDGSGGGGSTFVAPVYTPVVSAPPSTPSSIFPVEDEGLSFAQTLVEKGKDTLDATILTETGQRITNLVTGAGIALAIGTTVPTFVTILSLSEIAFLPLRLVSLFLSALGIKRRSWGVVYDSVTKQPIDPAYLTLSDEAGNEVASAITDLDGRYGFLTKKGLYRLSAAKSNYVFPSKILEGKTDDDFYHDLYFGGPIAIVADGSILNKNIPMDQVGFDWNEAAKREQKVMRYYTKRHKILYNVSRVFFYIGLLLSVGMVILIPKPYTIIVLALFGVTFLLRRIGVKPKLQGTVVEKLTGFGVPFTIVKVISKNTGVTIKNCITDVQGRYYCLVANGNYTVAVEKKKEDGSYERVQTKDDITVKNGVINSIFEI